MPYGIIKVDTITFTDAGVDKSIQISGLVQNPTFSGNVTCTGTISGVTITGSVAQFTTITGGSAGFTTVTGTTVTGTTANFVSGVFTSQISGTTVTGTTASFTSGNFTNISGGTHTITSGVFASGTAANPSISFVSDPNSGLYSPGGDQVAISTNGTGRVFIDDQGRVGVGAVPIAGSPNLELRGSSTTSGPSLGVTTSDYSSNFTTTSIRQYGSAATSTTAGLSRASLGELLFQNTSAGLVRTNGAAPIVFAVTDSERMRLTSDGRLGLGTSSPAVELDVASADECRIRARATTNGVDTRLTSLGLTGNAGIIGTYSNHPLVFYVNTAERARMDSSGRLLVGTSSAVATFNYAGADRTPRFQVVGDDINNGAAAIIRTGTAPSLFFGAGASGNNVSGSSTLSRIVFSGFHTDKYYTGAEILALVDGTPGASDMPSVLVFSTTADGASSPTERMRIAANGVVTIQNGAVAVIGTLTDGATITPDLAADCNFTVTLGGNRTIANPTNITAGQSGSIFLVQDGTGGRTASWGSYWDFPGGTAPTLSTAANAVDRVDYIVRSSTSIHTVFTANYS